MPYAYRSRPRSHACERSDGHRDIGIRAQTAPGDYAWSSGNSEVGISASIWSDKSTTETLTGRPHIHDQSSIRRNDGRYDGFDAWQSATSDRAHMSWSPQGGSK